MKQKLYVLLLGALLVCAFPACTKVELEDRPTPEEPDKPDPEPGVTMGHVTLTPDWGSIAPSTGLRLYFYPSVGEVVTKECTATGFSGDLEAGTYRVLAVNADAANTGFAGMYSYETATVTAPAIPASRAAFASRAGGTEVAQPSGLYHARIDEFILESGKSVELAFAPVALVKTVHLRFVLPGWMATESLSGALSGVYPSLLLSTMEPSAEALTASHSSYLTFDAALSGGEATATVTLLGMADPQGGTAYTNTLALELTGTGGRQYPLTADLTAALTQVIAANKGTLPAEVEFVIGLDNMLAPVVTVGDWVPSDETGVIL